MFRTPSACFRAAFGFLLLWFIAQSRTATGLNTEAFPPQAFRYDQLDRIDPNSNPTDANPSYDANGNTIYPGESEYDAENQLVAREQLLIVYDHEGNRVQKSTSSGSVNYLIDTQNPTGYAQVIAEYGSVSAPPLRAYAYGLDLISQREPQNNNRTHYYGYDGHGSVRLLIKEDGSEETHYDYDAFGVLISQGASTVENHYRYAGEQWDPDLEMYYLRARYMKPEEGRFWTMDSYEGADTDPLSLHKYLYCAAEPVNRIDPSGQFFDPSSTLFSGAKQFGLQTRNAIGVQASKTAAQRQLIKSIARLLASSVPLWECNVLSVNSIPVCSCLGGLLAAAAA